MKILFDHNVPAKLRRYIVGHEVYTAGWLQWNHLANGELIAAAEAHAFEVLVTGDRNLWYQQNNAKRRIALVVLSQLKWPAPLHGLTQIAAAIDRARPGSFELVEVPKQPQ